MSDLARELVRLPGDGRAFRMGRIVTGGTNPQTVVVNVDGADNTLPAVAGTYATGDTVLVARDARAAGYVVGRLGTAPVDPPVDPDAPPVEPGVIARTLTVVPASAGTWRPDAWRPGDQLHQGDYGGFGLNTGAAFYGDALTGLHADTGLPHSITVRYRRRPGGIPAAQVPAFWTLAEAARPTGAPTRLDTDDGTAVAVGALASWELPGAWATDLLDGAAGGLGIYLADDTPYMVLAGPSTYSAAFALTVNYYA